MSGPVSKTTTAPAHCDAWLAFTPRDTVIVRDGRSFDAGADSVAESVRPWPSTIAGATRAAYDEEPEQVRGPVLAKRARAGWTPYFPVPADLAYVPRDKRRDKRAVLLRPDSELDGVRSDLGDAVTRLLSPPAHADRVEPFEDRWMPVEVLKRHLAGALIADPGDDIEPAELRLLPEDQSPLELERRVGLARTRERTAREGYLFQATHLRPRSGWAFLVGCVFPDSWEARARGPVQMGGRGRLCDVETASGPIWPSAPTDFPGGRVLVYLATPAIWRDGWRLPVPEGAELTGAAVPAPQPVASASPYLARRENIGLLKTVTLRWAVPAGAVYLLTFTDAGHAARWAGEHHGRALPLDEGTTRKATREERRLSTAGFGVVLTGRWKGTGG